jgi:hypothetical protein
MDLSASSLITSSLAPATYQAYDKVIVNLKDFCLSKEVFDTPTESSIINFIVFLANSPRPSVAKLEQAVAALSIYCVMWDLPNPSSARLSHAIKGYKAAFSRPIVRKSPFKSEDGLG